MRKYLKSDNPAKQRTNMIAFRASTSDRQLAEEVMAASNSKYLSDMFRALLNEKAQELGVIK